MNKEKLIELYSLIYEVNKNTNSAVAFLRNFDESILLRIKLNEREYDKYNSDLESDYDLWIYPKQHIFYTPDESIEKALILLKELIKRG